MTIPPTRQDIRDAGARGGSRKRALALIAQAIAEYRQGRAASACMSDIEKAMDAVTVGHGKGAQ